MRYQAVAAERRLTAIRDVCCHLYVLLIHLDSAGQLLVSLDIWPSSRSPYYLSSFVSCLGLSSRPMLDIAQCMAERSMTT